MDTLIRSLQTQGFVPVIDDFPFTEEEEKKAHNIEINMLKKRISNLTKEDLKCLLFYCVVSDQTNIYDNKLLYEYGISDIDYIYNLEAAKEVLQTLSEERINQMIDENESDLYV